ncbi:hypothetical protein COO60DRAFT_1537989 [Scenedesmus sp. NREL 46B-D3]|nr:hypothetical protein COO60DRAFT_1537989 [Scenedesmus sp. NREL 46B-D3]
MHLLLLLLLLLIPCCHCCLASHLVPCPCRLPYGRLCAAGAAAVSCHFASAFAQHRACQGAYFCCLHTLLRVLLHLLRAAAGAAAAAHRHQKQHLLGLLIRRPLAGALGRWLAAALAHNAHHLAPAGRIVPLPHSKHPHAAQALRLKC